MALTEQQKDELRAYICKKSRTPLGAITPAVLKEYASKTDEEIIALLAADKAMEESRLEKLISEAQAKLTAIRG